MPNSKARLRLLSIPIACFPLVLLSLYPSVNEWTLFLGRFHPIVLHFPIGILMLTTLLELLEVFSRGRWKFATYPMLFLGTIGAVIAMSLGILLMVGENMEGVLVITHLRWGIATTVCALLALTIRSLPAYSATPNLSKLYRSLLIITCAIMGWASHQGGSITHGETYLTEHLPWSSEPDGSGFNARLSKPLEEKIIYSDIIAPIFEAKCYECHSTRSFKGRLVMDTYEGLLKGGALGPAIVPEIKNESLALSRILLPISDEEHMPPAGKPQFTTQETMLLIWWIHMGAPEQIKAGDTDPTDEIKLAISEISDALNSAMHAVQEDPLQELTAKDIATLRTPYADEVEKLQQTYPGIIRYENGQSPFLVVISYHNTWTDDDLKKLEPVSSIVRELILPGSTLTESSATLLNTMDQLQVLDLRNSDVDDAFILALNLTHAARLNLFGSSASTNAINELKAVLPDSTILYAY